MQNMLVMVHCQKLSFTLNLLGFIGQFEKHELPLYYYECWN